MCINVSPTGVLASDKTVVLFGVCELLLGFLWKAWWYLSGPVFVTANILVNYKSYGNIMHADAWNQTSQPFSVDMKHK